MVCRKLSKMRDGARCPMHYRQSVADNTAASVRRPNGIVVFKISVFSELVPMARMLGARRRHCRVRPNSNSRERIHRSRAACDMVDFIVGSLSPALKRVKKGSPKKLEERYPTVRWALFRGDNQARSRQGTIAMLAMFRPVRRTSCTTLPSWFNSTMRCPR